MAAITAIGLARRRPSHRPAAVALFLLTLIAECRGGTVAALRGLPRPVEGAARWIVYMDGALVLASGAVVAGLAVTVTSTPEERRRAASIVVGAWAVASLALAMAYPSPWVRGTELHRLYLIVDLVGLFVALVALSRIALLRLSPDSAQSIAIGLVVLDLGILLAPYSPWRESIFASPHDPVQVGILVFFSAFTAAHGVLWLIYSRRVGTQFCSRSRRA